MSGLVMQQHELKYVCFGWGVLTILFLFLLQSNSKLKLVRSLAVCEESSSPFVDGLLESQVGLEWVKLWSVEAQKIHILLELMSCPGLVGLSAKNFPQEAAFEGSCHACEHCLYVYSHNPSLMRNHLHQLPGHPQVLKLCRLNAPENGMALHVHKAHGVLAMGRKFLCKPFSCSSGCSDWKQPAHREVICTALQRRSPSVVTMGSDREAESWRWAAVSEALRTCLLWRDHMGWAFSAHTSFRSTGWCSVRRSELAHCRSGCG